MPPGCGGGAPCPGWREPQLGAALGAEHTPWKVVEGEVGGVGAGWAAFQAAPPGADHAEPAIGFDEAPAEVVKRPGPGGIALRGDDDFKRPELGRMVEDRAVCDAWGAGGVSQLVLGDKADDLDGGAGPVEDGVEDDDVAARPHAVEGDKGEGAVRAEADFELVFEFGKPDGADLIDDGVEAVAGEGLDRLEEERLAVGDR